MEEKVKSLLQIPSAERMGLMIAFGYPANEVTRPKIRKEMTAMVRWNYYSL